MGGSFASWLVVFCLIQPLSNFFLVQSFQLLVPLFCTDKASNQSLQNSMTSPIGNDVTAVSCTVENWRSIPQPKDTDEGENFDDHQQLMLLSDRPLWSEACYRDSLDLYNRLMQCTDSYVSENIRASLTCLDHALRLYGPSSVICSFNGGKDAVVILHLVRAAVANHYNNNAKSICTRDESGKIATIVRPRVVYFDHKNEFPEILDFLHEIVEKHDLDMIAFDQGTKFQDGLKILTERNFAETESRIVLPMAFVLGTRLTDPNAVGQQQFAPSSHYMPPFMRVNPILDWTYGHVWHFLRLFQLSYCSLYDQGYTSLGTVKDTLPCPALAVAGHQASQGGLPKYWPAYMLRDWDQERAGRLSRDQVAYSTKATRANRMTRSHDEIESGGKSETETASIGHLSVMSECRVLKNANESSGSMEIIDYDVGGGEHTSVSYRSDDALRTAALLIIGDEILKGYTVDTNTQEAAVVLRANNVLLKSVVVVSDDPDEIASEIRRLQKTVDVIITSGGVGATHDDCTMKAVAKAIKCHLILHEEMADLLRAKMNASTASGNGEPVPLTEAQIKMATLPSCAKLRYLSKDKHDWPILQVKQLFILPGIPEYFKDKVANLGAYIGCQLKRSTAYKVVLQVHEDSIVPILNQVVKNHPSVVFGSYPFVSHPEYKTVITVEDRLVPLERASNIRSNSTVFDQSLLEMDNPKDFQNAAVQQALDELIQQLPEGSVLRVESDDMTLFS